jgi:hypothetical protein
MRLMSVSSPPASCRSLPACHDPSRSGSGKPGIMQQHSRQITNQLRVIRQPDRATADADHDQQAAAFQQFRTLATGRLPQRSRGKIAPNLLRGNPR